MRLQDLYEAAVIGGIAGGLVMPLVFAATSFAGFVAGELPLADLLWILCMGVLAGAVAGWLVGTFVAFPILAFAVRLGWYRPSVPPVLGALVGAVVLPQLGFATTFGTFATGAVSGAFGGLITSRRRALTAGCNGP